MKKEAKLFFLSVLAAVAVIIVTNLIINKSIEDDNSISKQDIHKAGMGKIKPPIRNEKLAPKDDSLEPEQEAPLPKNTPLLN